MSLVGELKEERESAEVLIETYTSQILGNRDRNQYEFALGGLSSFFRTRAVARFLIDADVSGFRLDLVRSARCQLFYYCHIQMNMQYSASIGQPMVRNAGEALGTGASIAFAGAASANPSLTAPLFTSTVQFTNLSKMEDMIAGEQPTERGGFTGLHAPKWPAETFGSIKTELAERGAKLYGEICEHCHLPPKGSKALWDDGNHRRRPT